MVRIRTSIVADDSLSNLSDPEAGMYSTSVEGSSPRAAATAIQYEMSSPERTPVAESRYPIPYWDSLTPHFMDPRSTIVSRVLTAAASAVPAAYPLSYAASTSSWVTSDPAQPARAAVVINSIIVIASMRRMPSLRGIDGIYLLIDVVDY